MSNHLLALKNIDIAYGDLTVVKDFSLDVDAGEFVSLLGPSGCGKTTTLRAIAGFLGVASGKIILNGEDITHESAERRDIGIVFQNYALFPTMTAYENIAFGLRVAKKSNAEIKQRVTEIAQTSGIVQQLQKRPAEMSGGQQQRVAIARALIMGAKVLLFDEPLSNLDAKVRVSMRKEIKRLQAKFGFTAFFVTHDQDEALAMSDRVVVLRDGHIEQIGSGRELYESPVSPFVCEFIGEANQVSERLAKSFSGFDLTGQIYIRPEDFSMHYRETSGEGEVDAIISHIEYLGAEVLVDCLVDDERLSVAMFGFNFPNHVKPGDKVQISARANAWHVFPVAK